ncbi:MAG: S8 family serine peptidase [Ideonella sp.]|nr:S8 family serine peptidase [Ideonella sp.]
MPVIKTLRSLLLVLGLALLGPALLAAAPERGPLRRAWKAAPEDPSNARVIVKYRAGSRLMQALAVGRAAPLPQHANALAKRLSLPLSDGRVLGRHTQGLRGVGLSSSQLAARLAAQPDVEWAVVDRRRRWSYVPGDPYFAAGQTGELPAVGQWYLRAPDATIVSAVNAVGAWDLTRGSSALTVAVLDTGVRFDHPDLANKLYPGYDFIKDIPTAGDGNGRDANASDPGDWTNDDECSPGEPASSSSWHGTQVSGLVAAASDNGIGIGGHCRSGDGAAGARAGALWRLGRGHHCRHALGGRTVNQPGAQHPSGQGAQPQPRRGRHLRAELPGPDQRVDGCEGHRRGRCRQRRRAGRGRAGQLPRRDRRGRVAPQRHQGGLLQPGTRSGRRRPRRQLREHARGLPLPLADDHQQRHHHAGRQHLQRCVERESGHEFLHAHRGRRGGVDVVDRSHAHARRHPGAAAVHGAALPDHGR